MPTVDALVCGAGIAGVAIAHRLTTVHGLERILLVDDRAPLSLTSDKSTEAYRNWWPGPDGAMIAFMNRSIDLLEALADETDNRIGLNRYGYVYATADAARAASLAADAERASRLGAGDLRRHPSATASYDPARGAGFHDVPLGADLFTTRSEIERHFPYLAPDTCAVLHARRCGWFSGHGLGMLLLERARDAGATLLKGRVAAVQSDGSGVASVTVATRGGETRIATRTFIVAAGPYARDVAALTGVDLPLFSELHLKASFEDDLAVIPRQAPLVVWEDPQSIAWDEEERAVFAESADTAWLLNPFPPAVHMRPEGASGVLMLWPYHTRPVDVRFPLPEDPLYPEVVLRGLTRAIPGLAPYKARLPRTFVDGGYYTKTRENRFLAGPLPMSGAFVLAGLSGYGLMAACGAAELVAAHVTSGALPEYADAFRLERYADPVYVAKLDSWGSTGQL